jgi:hypothetical protein
MLYGLETDRIVSNADFQNEVYVLFRKLLVILHMAVTHANEALPSCVFFVKHSTE